MAGKVAVVTGAAGGIGVAAGMQLLDEGCMVVAVDLDAERIAAVFPGADKERFLTVAADIARPGEIADLMVYLLSDEASFQTGGVYRAEGGALLV